MENEAPEPPAPTAPDAPPPAAAEALPPPPPAEPPPPAWLWEDRVAMAAAAVAVLAALLPWYSGGPWLAPGRDPLVTGALAALALTILLATRGPQNQFVRRVVCFALGLLLLALSLWVAYKYYLFHAGIAPKKGIMGHALYLGVGLDLTIVAGAVLAWCSIPTSRAAPGPTPLHPFDERALPFAKRYLVPLVILLVAYNVYHEEVAEPSIIDFDEAHYVRVALNMTDGILIDPSWGEPRPFNFEHPPVGKYLIALGYALAGEPHDELDWPAYKDLCDTDNPDCAKDAAGWRWGSVLVGSLGVLGMYWLGLRLFRSVAGGVFAAAFLLLDNLYYLHSRTALLDIFAAGFSLLALGVMMGPSRAHPWIGGAIYGLALAGKHTALFVLPVVLLILYLRAPIPTIWMRVRRALLAGLFTPLIVYFTSYAPYLVLWAKMRGPLYALEMFQYIHVESVRWTYAADVEPHPFVSRPWTWLSMVRPVFYYVGYNGQQDVAHIYAIGNPAVWWLGFAALLAFLAAGATAWARNRPRLGLRAFVDWAGRPFHLTPARGRVLAALLFVSAFAPFFVLQRDPFNFYFLTAAPFLSLLLAGVAAPLWERGNPDKLLAIVLLVTALAVFAFYHPVVSNTFIKEEDFQYIMHRIPHMRQ